MTGAPGRLRILYVVNFDTGGSIVSLRTLLGHLDRDRFDPAVLFYRSNPHCDEFRDLGAAVYVLRGPGTVDPLPDVVGEKASPLKRVRALRILNRFFRKELPRASEVTRVTREIQPDLVSHNDNLRAHRGSVLGVARTGIPQICHVRSLTDYYGLLDVPLALTVDHFVYISDAVAASCRDELHVGPSRGTRVWDPVDMNPLPHPDRDRQRVRDELGYGPDQRVVTNVGRLVPGKGQDVFLEAMEQVIREVPGARALIVGGSESRDGGESFERRLRAIANRRGLRGRVRFTGHRDDVPAIMAASDLIVHSARNPEGLGRVLVEALALERPVIGTATGGVADVIRHGETGWLVPPEDVNVLARTIGRALAQPELARSMARRGRRFVERRFSIPTHVGSMERVYRDVGRVDRTGSTTGRDAGPDESESTAGSTDGGGVPTSSKHEHVRRQGA